MPNSTIQPNPRLARTALRRGAALLIYPGGVKDVFRPYQLRHRINFQGHRGFIQLALQEEVTIIPLISYGAHSTLIVLGDIYSQLQQLHRWGMPWLGGIDPTVFPIYLGWPWGVAIGPLPNIPFPLKLHTRVCPPIIFERYGRAASHDRDYVQQCYRQVVETMQGQLEQLVMEEERGLLKTCWSNL